ncbi:MAG: hypothetical protein RL539_1663, partial [Pseudomonadota bacterium]
MNKNRYPTVGEYFLGFAAKEQCGDAF